MAGLGRGFLEGGGFRGVEGGNAVWLLKNKPKASGFILQAVAIYYALLGSAPVVVVGGVRCAVQVQAIRSRTGVGGSGRRDSASRYSATTLAWSRKCRRRSQNIAASDLCPAEGSLCLDWFFSTFRRSLFRHLCFLLAES